jgi:hypothetical protein
MNQPNPDPLPPPPPPTPFDPPKPLGPPRFAEGEHRLVGRVEPPQPSHAGHLPIGAPSA